jgi:hypothetical protein
MVAALEHFQRSLYAGCLLRLYEALPCAAGVQEKRHMPLILLRKGMRKLTTHHFSKLPTAVEAA